LFSFHAGGSLDAQAQGGSTNHANYAFGVYTAAAGFSLNGALSGANFYASFPGQYDDRDPSSFDANFTSTPTTNVVNITNGFNNQTNGTPCTQ
jgi:hypothetical protein